MDKKLIDKMRRLERIAREDEIFQVYEKSCNELESWQKKLVRFFPVGIRRKLTARVEYQKMLHQRMMILACDHMDFK